MRCPVCRFDSSKVVETRMLEDDRCLRRRRECLDCQARFTTYERIETNLIVVIKKNNEREALNTEKLSRGIYRALEKRPWTGGQKEKLINKIIEQIRDYALDNNNEIASERIGEIVLSRLKKFDKVAYIRFASVYKSFDDLESFQQELDKLI